MTSAADPRRRGDLSKILHFDWVRGVAESPERRRDRQCAKRNLTIAVGELIASGDVQVLLFARGEASLQRQFPLSHSAKTQPCK
jgi:hypothetical protein